MNKKYGYDEVEEMIERAKEAPLAQDKMHGFDVIEQDENDGRLVLKAGYYCYDADDLVSQGFTVEGACDQWERAIVYVDGPGKIVGPKN